MSATTAVGLANNKMRSDILAGAMKDPAFKHKLCTTPTVEEHFPGVFFKGVFNRVLGFKDEDFKDEFDPHGNRDLIVVECMDKELRMRPVWGIIDCYDNDMAAGSENPEDDTCTTRVLTIMMPEDY